MAIVIEDSDYAFEELGLSIGHHSLFFKDLFPKAQKRNNGYFSCLKSSIISTFAPEDTIEQIAIVRSEGFMASCSHEFYFWTNIDY